MKEKNKNCLGYHFRKELKKSNLNVFWGDILKGEFHSVETLMHWVWVPLTFMGIAFTISTFNIGGIPQRNLEGALSLLSACTFFIVLYWVSVQFKEDSIVSFSLRALFYAGSGTTFVLAVLSLGAVFGSQNFVLFLSLVAGFVIGLGGGGYFLKFRRKK